MEAALLIELLTEELPPKSLRMLGNAFADQLVAEIVKYRLKDRDPRKQTFATPRRLAVLIPEVREKALESSHSVEGPTSSNTKGVEGFARKHKVPPKSLERVQTEKGEIVVAKFTLPGVDLDAVLANIVEGVLKKLPVPKMMRWGSGDAQFVRPVQGLVMLHGTRVVPGTVLGLQSGNRTRGHRFMGKSEIILASADEYEARLRDEGMVIADSEKRKSEIDKQLQIEAKKQNASLGEYRVLLDEVTALVEQPSVYVGEFDKAFLELPQECLILTMRQNQKYFPLFNPAGKLLPKFLIVSNMKVADPRKIVEGNERVIRPRFEDARFFFDQDRKTSLKDRVPQLAKVVYQSKLGTQLDRVNRLESLARQFAGVLRGERVSGADESKAKSAAHLSKADLLTGMVGEFPELQGIMGAHYARHDGVDAEIAQAIEEHYLPRFSGDQLPQSIAGVAVALADKLDSIFGMFGIGQIPTGEKDPLALRRQALGIVRIIIEKQLPLNLDVLFIASEDALYGRIAEGVSEKVYDFLLDRLRNYLREQGFEASEIESVLALSPKRLDQVPAKLAAVRAFMALPEAQSLAAANKRIRNIIHKSNPPTRDLFSTANLKEAAERALYEGFKGIDAIANAHLSEGRYKEALLSLAALKSPVDAFFDTVMVNVDDQALRNNRLSLLMQLDSSMNQVADISKLAA